MTCTVYISDISLKCLKNKNINKEFSKTKWTIILTVVIIAEYGVCGHNVKNQHDKKPAGLLNTDDLMSHILRVHRLWLSKYNYGILFILIILYTLYANYQYKIVFMQVTYFETKVISLVLKKLQVVDVLL